MFQIAMFTLSCSVIPPGGGNVFDPVNFLGEARGTSGDQRTWGVAWEDWPNPYRGEYSPHESFEMSKNFKKER